VQLVKLFGLMWQKQLVDSGSSQEMLARFTESVAKGETFMTRASYFYPAGSGPWTVENTKLGIGPQGPGNGGPTVYSETSILKHAASSKEFVVGAHSRLSGPAGCRSRAGTPGQPANQGGNDEGYASRNSRSSNPATSSASAVS
jgi:hypothetical protein